MSDRLNRFIEAQEQQYDGYQTALGEMKAGRKMSHWIWYIFPQIAGLGRSGMSAHYGITNLDEAKAYLEHPVLGAHLREIRSVVLALDDTDPVKVMGSFIDAMKLKSSMTLFLKTGMYTELFQGVLDKYYGGVMCDKTLRLLRG